MQHHACGEHQLHILAARDSHPGAHAARRLRRGTRRVQHHARAEHLVAFPRPEGKSFLLNIKGPELLNKYVGEMERDIRRIAKRVVANTHTTRKISAHSGRV